MTIRGLVMAVVVSAVVLTTVSAQRNRGKRLTDYPIEPYCSVCLKKKKIDGPRRKLRLMEFDGDAVLEHVKSRHIVYIETAYSKIVSTLPGYKISPTTSKRLLLELPHLRTRFPALKGNQPKLDGHQVAHLIALHLHRVKLEFWELFGTRALSYSGYMGRENKHEIYLFANQRDYNRFTDRFTGVRANGGQEIVLHTDKALGFVRPPPKRAGLNTWNNTVTHMWAHLLLECQIRNGYNMLSWLDAGFAHWWERREHPSFNTYCFSEARDVGVFGSGKWRARVRRLVATKKAEPFAAFFDKKDMSSMNDMEHGLAFGVMDYIINHKKKELRSFVQRLGGARTLNPHNEFRKAFGQSVSAFEEEWRKWVLKNFPRR